MGRGFSTEGINSLNQILDKIRASIAVVNGNVNYKVVRLYNTENNQTTLRLGEDVEFPESTIFIVNGQMQEFNTDYTVENNRLFWKSSDFCLSTTDNLTLYY